MTSYEEFENIICTRCGGSGQYSYCQTMTGKYGPTTCFKCSGSGQSFTKRGALAFKMYTDSLNVPASDICPGNLIRDDLSQRFVLVLAVAQEVKETVWNHTYPNGEKMSKTFRMFEIHTAKCSHVLPPDDSIRLAHTMEQKHVKRAAAIEYQATLTKAGKPRRRK